MRRLINISRPATILHRSILQLPHTQIRSIASQPTPETPKMKRKQAPSSDLKSPAKKAKPDVPEYHATPSIKEEDGSIQWPAPKDQIENARKIILEW